MAKNARLEIERKTGRKVISPLNASDTGALDISAAIWYYIAVLREKGKVL